MSHSKGKVMLSGPSDRERYQPSSAICTPAGPSPELFIMSACASWRVDGWSSTAASSQRYLEQGGTGRRRPLSLPCETSVYYLCLYKMPHLHIHVRSREFSF